MTDDDLVPFLRHLAVAKNMSGFKIRPAIIQAADEIERLRNKILDLEMTRRLDAQIQSHVSSRATD